MKNVVSFSPQMNDRSDKNRSIYIFRKAILIETKNTIDLK